MMPACKWKQMSFNGFCFYTEHKLPVSTSKLRLTPTWYLIASGVRKPCIKWHFLFYYSGLLPLVVFSHQPHTFSNPGARQLVTCDITLLQAMPQRKLEPTRWKLMRKDEEEGERWDHMCSHLTTSLETPVHLKINSFRHVDPSIRMRKEGGLRDWMWHGVKKNKDPESNRSPGKNEWKGTVSVS